MGGLATATQSTLLSLNIQKLLVSTRLFTVLSKKISLDYYAGIIGGFSWLGNYGHTKNYKLYQGLRMGQIDQQYFHKYLNKGSGVLGLQTTAWFRLNGFSLFQLSLRYQYLMNPVVRSKVVLSDMFNPSVTDEIEFNAGQA